MFEVQGKLEVIYDAQQVTDRFKKREFVLEVQSGMYPEYVKMQLTQDRCSLLDGLKAGDIVKASFNLRGRPYTKNGETTYFTNLEAWRIETVQAGQAQGAAPSAQAPAAKSSGAAAPDPTGMTFSAADEDDLPF
jgi:hypothetical protein